MRGRGDLWPQPNWSIIRIILELQVHKSDGGDSGPDADNCSIEKVRITLVPFPFLHYITDTDSMLGPHNWICERGNIKQCLEILGYSLKCLRVYGGWH